MARDRFALLRWLAAVLPDKRYLQLRYCIKFGRFPDIDNPKGFNEHLLHLIVTKQQSGLRSLVADKLSMRYYVARKVGMDNLSKIYQVVVEFDRLNLALLPNQFALKANHGCGQVALVHGTRTCDRSKLREICRGWLATDHSARAREYVYREIGRLLYAEELLLGLNGELANDVKAYVFFGNVRFFRINQNSLRGDYDEVYYDRNWKPLPFCNPYYERNRFQEERGPSVDWEKPKQLNRMIEIAERLGEEFTFIRVDFCDMGDRFVIMELTNFPASGNDPFHPASFEDLLGSLFVPQDALSPSQAAQIARYFP